jgi:two-component system, cell cycle sensor histidine kinase and response regulator CckA
VMPQIDGHELARRVRQARPDTRVLYMSGYGGHAIVDHDGLDAAISYVQKPLAPTKLARAVRAALDASALATPVLEREPA